MKLREKIILFLTTILSFSNVMPSRKVSADVNPYALIQTVNDETSANPNNSFAQAHSKTVGSLTQPTSYSGNIEGLISSSTDVDYFKFNVYANSTITFVLSMINSDMEDMYEYTISVYKHDNKVDVDADDITLLGTTSQPGTYDMYYNNNIIPGVYYVKVFSAVGDYSTRFSYRLNYSISFETKNTINIEEYALENPNSYLVWTSDFNVCEEKTIINQEKEFSNFPNEIIPNNIIQEFVELNGYMNMEIYLWGRALRNSLSELIQEYIDFINLKKDEIITDRNIRLGIENAIVGTTLVINAALIFYTPANIYETITCEFIIPIVDVGLAFFFDIASPTEAENIETLLQYYSGLKSALNVVNNTSDSEIIVISQKSSFVTKNNKLVLKNNFEEINSRYVLSHKLQSPVLSEIKGFSNVLNSNDYFEIYGTITEANPVVDFERYLNENLE